MKRLIISFVILAQSIPVVAEVSTDSSRGNTAGQDRTMSLKKSIENKISNLTSHGSDSTASRTDRLNGSLGGGGGLDLSIPSRALIPEDIIQYKLPADFGLAARANGAWINTSYQEYISQQAKSGALVSNIAGENGEKDLREYLYSVATFGARAGQAQIILNNWAAKIGKIKRSKSGALEVSGLGSDDLVTLAAGAWQKAEYLTDTRLLSDLDNIRNDQTSCRLSGDPATIQCGAAVLHLSTPPSLKYRDVDWYGGAFAGINGIYKVSSSWSWSKALENAKSNSTFVKKQADELEASGEAFDAVMARKQAVEKSRTNRSTLSSGKPGQN